MDSLVEPNGNLFTAFCNSKILTPQFVLHVTFLGSAFLEGEMAEPSLKKLLDVHSLLFRICQTNSKYSMDLKECNNFIYPTGVPETCQKQCSFSYGSTIFIRDSFSGTLCILAQEASISINSQLH